MGGTAAALAFLVILSSSVHPPASAAPPPPLNPDVVGLLVFKSGLTDPAGSLATWQDDTPPCTSWAHVACSPSSGRVISVILSGFNLSGKLNRGLSQLSSLSSLSLSSNNFSGDLPAATAALPPSLRRLDLSSNAFSGHLSAAALAALRRLSSLNLAANRLAGTLTPAVALLRNLQSLNLSRNSFSGELPNALQWLPSLRLLDLSRNAFSGDFPAWILNNLTAIADLDLSWNGIGGELPAIGGAPMLRRLRLRGNELEGGIPGWVMGLGLEELDLAENRISGGIPAGSAALFEGLRRLDLAGNRISGEIPAEVALWKGLRELNLSGNEGMRARVRGELGFLRNLTVVDLRGCGLYGSIPPELCDSGSIEVLQLDRNSLSGPIPPEIANCSSLHLLGLSRNELNGSIPGGMGSLAKLEILSLESNNLSGEIPSSLGRLPSLLALNLSHNRLVGRLPAGGLFPSLPASAIAFNLGLCSPLVSQPCILNLPKPLVLDPHKYPSPTTYNPSSSAEAPAERRRVLSVSAVVALAAAGLIALGVAVVAALNAAAGRRAPRAPASSRGSSRSGDPAVGKLVLFGGGALPDDVLDKAVELGRGALGPVYRAAAGPGKPVAVRKLAAADVVPYHDEFDREVRALARARHPNLVSLKGYYWTPQAQLLVADYAAGGSLADRLRRRPPLAWPDRFRIAAGAAAGLAHLHRAFRPPIVHYDFKPANVLLSARGDALVADFGLARLLSSRAATYPAPSAYVAPEMACRGLRVNERCDVYSFGVVVLELVTGRMTDDGDDALGPVEEVRERVEAGLALECVDPEMGPFPEEEVLPVLKLALVCASQIPSSRPSMAEVVQILQVIGTPADATASSSAAAVVATASSSF
ncbi:uncharacterized protein LOC144704908 [Wolffia australiana]